MSQPLATMYRLERRFRRVEAALHRPFFSGLSIHSPRVGDYFVHVLDGNGERRSVRVLASGEIAGIETNGDRP